MKIKANWLGKKSLIIRQYLVSLLSYIKSPFTKKNPEAAKKYFSCIYNHSIEDDLIFDGNSFAYFEKVQCLLPAGNTVECIYDCGCGEASFLRFIQDNAWHYQCYIGIDYAITPQKLSGKEELIQADITKFDFNAHSKECLLVFTNVFCYLSDAAVQSILSKISKPSTRLLIVEPIPGLFWDATFSNVQLYYRTNKKLTRLLEKYGFKRKGFVKDYLFKIGGFFLVSLSSAAIYEFEEVK